MAGACAFTNMCGVGQLTACTLQENGARKLHRYLWGVEHAHHPVLGQHFTHAGWRLDTPAHRLGVAVDRLVVILPR